MAALGAACEPTPAQSSYSLESAEATAHWLRLVDLWQWQRYWLGAWDLSPLLREGQETSVSVAAIRTDLGLYAAACFPTISECLVYSMDAPSAFGATAKVPVPRHAPNPAAELQTAVTRATGGKIRVGIPLLATDFRRIPSQAPPRAIRMKTVPDHWAAEEGELVRLLGCPRSQGSRSTEIWVPYFADHDPGLLVLRICEGEGGREESGFFLMRDQRGWHLNAGSKVAPSIARQKVSGVLSRRILVR